MQKKIETTSEVGVQIFAHIQGIIYLQQSNQIGQNVTAMVSSMSNPSLRGYAHELMMCT